MPRKEYRERGRDLGKLNYPPASEHHSSGFISYSSHLRKKEDQEMKVLEKIDYNYSCMPVNKNDNEIFLFMKHKKRDDTQLQEYSKHKHTSGNVIMNEIHPKSTAKKLTVTVTSPH